MSGLDDTSIDIVLRLRERADLDEMEWGETTSAASMMREAADAISEAQAQIARQAEALNAVFNATPPGTHYCSPDMQLVKEALTHTSETVAAWRAKETKPLRMEADNKGAIK